MAFDRESIAVVIVQPLRLLVEGCSRLLRQLGRIGLEKHAVADIDDKVLLTSWGSGARQSSLVGLLGAARNRKARQDHRSELKAAKIGAAKDRRDIHSGALHISAGPA